MTAPPTDPVILMMFGGEPTSADAGRAMGWLRSLSHEDAKHQALISYTAIAAAETRGREQGLRETVAALVHPQMEDAADESWNDAIAAILALIPAPPAKEPTNE